MPALPCIIHILRALVTTRLARPRMPFRTRPSERICEGQSELPSANPISVRGRGRECVPRAKRMFDLTRSAMDANARRSTVRKEVSRGPARGSDEKPRKAVATPRTVAPTTYWWGGEATQPDKRRKFGVFYSTRRDRIKIHEPPPIDKC